MNAQKKVECNSLVVCQYTRHWDTHRINEDIGKLTDAALREIEEAGRSLEFGFSREFTSHFQFEHYSEDSAPAWLIESLKDLGKTPSPSGFKRGFLVLIANVEIDKDQYKNALLNSDGSLVEEGEFSDDVLIEVYKDFVTSILSSYAFLFSLAVNIAKPGAFQFTSRYLAIDKKIIRTDPGVMNSFESSFDVSSKFSWPPVALLNVFEVWDWLVKIPGFTTGESKTSLGRAIGALSYLLNDSKNQNELALVWALIGLEALYGKGNTGLKSQLMEKSESFLGKRVSHKKEFGNMYDFRSRLVHGDQNFHFNGFEGVLEEEYSLRLWDSENFALAALISTVQKMCSHQIDELGFRMIVDSVS